MRATNGSGEVAVPIYELFSSTEVWGRMALERISTATIGESAVAFMPRAVIVSHRGQDECVAHHL
jgi:hypothetical protein